MKETMDQKESMEPAARELTRLISIMATLRQPGGCPWDQKQDSLTLRPYLLEETYEVLEAIDAGDPEWLCEELGDLLLQIVFHAQIHSETATFSMHDIIRLIADKMERRHPHVFGDHKFDSDEELRVNWDRIKQQEKTQHNPQRRSATLPAHLPALQKAQKIHAKQKHAPTEGRLKADELSCPLEESLTHLKTMSKNDLEAVLPRFIYALTGLAEAQNIDCEGALRTHLDRLQEPRKRK